MHVVQESLERVVVGDAALDTGWLVVIPLCLLAGALVAAAVRRVEDVSRLV